MKNYKTLSVLIASLFFSNFILAQQQNKRTSVQKSSSEIQVSATDSSFNAFTDNKRLKVTPRSADSLQKPFKKEDYTENVITETKRTKATVRQKK